MTWQLGSMLVLGLALLAGFAWYERAKPDARVVALVATLAAFAIVGRIAFAAIPNIKPTTDIVLISGYALGGGPGFAVGAISGLVSNFFFGQGPWTPWQMAAWGVTGLLGAGLAIVTRNRIGRWRLAAVCTVIGFAFTVVQDFGDWVTYSDHSLTQLATYVGTGIGFDFIDAFGCLVFALLLGPTLLRSIQRFTRRLQVRWSTAPALPPVLIALVVALSVLGVKAQSANAAATPTGYLLSAQNRDGGLGAAIGEPSAELYAGWAALGLESVGINPARVRNGGPSLLSYVKSASGSLAGAGNAGALERTILVVTATGASATDVDGHDLIAELDHDFAADGSVSNLVDLTTFGILALRADPGGVPIRTLTWLAKQQDSDGGFSFGTAGDQADVDDTGAALEALAGAPNTSRTRARAIAFIEAQQNSDGGFPSQAGGFSDAQSTAWAIQGLIAAGVNPAKVHHGHSPSPLGYLRSLIGSDGAIAYSKGEIQTPVWVTGEALMALARKPLPLRSQVGLSGSIFPAPSNGPSVPMIIAIVGAVAALGLAARWRRAILRATLK